MADETLDIASLKSEIAARRANGTATEADGAIRGLLAELADGNLTEKEFKKALAKAQKN